MLNKNFNIIVTRNHSKTDWSAQNAALHQHCVEGRQPQYEQRAIKGMEHIAMTISSSTTREAKV
jgi:hypothetical protein